MTMSGAEMHIRGHVPSENLKRSKIEQISSESESVRISMERLKTPTERDEFLLKKIDELCLDKLRLLRDVQRFEASDLNLHRTIQNLEIEKQSLTNWCDKLQNDARDLEEKVRETSTSYNESEERVKFLMSKFVAVVSSSGGPDSLPKDAVRKMLNESKDQSSTLEDLKGTLDDVRGQNRDLAQRLSDEQRLSAKLHEQLCDAQKLFFRQAAMGPSGAKKLESATQKVSDGSSVDGAGDTHVPKDGEDIGFDRTGELPDDDVKTETLSSLGILCPNDRDENSQTDRNSESTLRSINECSVDPLNDMEERGVQRDSERPYLRSCPEDAEMPFSPALSPAPRVISNMSSDAPRIECTKERMPSVASSNRAAFINSKPSALTGTIINTTSDTLPNLTTDSGSHFSELESIADGVVSSMSSTIENALSSYADVNLPSKSTKPVITPMVNPISPILVPVPGMNLNITTKSTGPTATTPIIQSQICTNTGMNISQSSQGQIATVYTTGSVPNPNGFNLDNTPLGGAQISYQGSNPPSQLAYQGSNPPSQLSYQGSNPPSQISYQGSNPPSQSASCGSIIMGSGPAQLNVTTATIVPGGHYTMGSCGAVNESAMEPMDGDIKDGQQSAAACAMGTVVETNRSTMESTDGDIKKDGQRSSESQSTAPTSRSPSKPLAGTGNSTPLTNATGSSCEPSSQAAENQMAHMNETLNSALQAAQVGGRLPPETTMNATMAAVNAGTESREESENNEDRSHIQKMELLLREALDKACYDKPVIRHSKGIYEFGEDLTYIKLVPKTETLLASADDKNYLPIDSFIKDHIKILAYSVASKGSDNRTPPVGAGPQIPKEQHSGYPTPIAPQQANMGHPSMTEQQASTGYPTPPATAQQPNAGYPTPPAVAQQPITPGITNFNGSTPLTYQRSNTPILGNKSRSLTPTINILQRSATPTLLGQNSGTLPLQSVGIQPQNSSVSPMSQGSNGGASNGKGWGSFTFPLTSNETAGSASIRPRQTASIQQLAGVIQSVSNKDDGSTVTTPNGSPLERGVLKSQGNDSGILDQQQQGWGVSPRSVPWPNVAINRNWSPQPKVADKLNISPGWANGTAQQRNESPFGNFQLRPFGSPAPSAPSTNGSGTMPPSPHNTWPMPAQAQGGRMSVQQGVQPMNNVPTMTPNAIPPLANKRSLLSSIRPPSISHIQQRAHSGSPARIGHGMWNNNQMQ